VANEGKKGRSPKKKTEHPLFPQLASGEKKKVEGHITLKRPKKEKKKGGALVGARWEAEKIKRATQKKGTKGAKIGDRWRVPPPPNRSPCRGGGKIEKGCRLAPSGKKKKIKKKKKSRSVGRGGETQAVEEEKHSTTCANIQHPQGKKENAGTRRAEGERTKLSHRLPGRERGEKKEKTDEAKITGGRPKGGGGKRKRPYTLNRVPL